MATDEVAEPDIPQRPGPIADIWMREAGRRGISVRPIAAEDGRVQFLNEKARRGLD